MTNDERHEEALDIIEEDGAEILRLKAEVKRLRTERDLLARNFGTKESGVAIIWDGNTVVAVAMIEPATKQRELLP